MGFIAGLGFQRTESEIQMGCWLFCC